MIHIEQNQNVPENENLRVYSPSGDYSEVDLIECYDIRNPDLAICSFQAQFLKYGGVVYQYSAPEELGAKLIEIDPESTHDAVALYKEEEERRIKRLAGKLKPENPVPAKDSLALEQEIKQLDEMPSADNAEPFVSPELTPEPETTPPADTTPPAPQEVVPGTENNNQ